MSTCTYMYMYVHHKTHVHVHVYPNKAGQHGVDIFYQQPVHSAVGSISSFVVVAIIHVQYLLYLIYIYIPCAKPGGMIVVNNIDLKNAPTLKLFPFELITYEGISRFSLSTPAQYFSVTANDTCLAFPDLDLPTTFHW